MKPYPFKFNTLLNLRHFTWQERWYVIIVRQFLWKIIFNLLFDNHKEISFYFRRIHVTAWTPLIHGFNDSEEDIKNILFFLREIKNLIRYEILLYHRIRWLKYHQLGRIYPLSGIKTIANQHASLVRKFAKKMME